MFILRLPNSWKHDPLQFPVLSPALFHLCFRYYSAPSFWISEITEYWYLGRRNFFFKSPEGCKCGNKVLYHRTIYTCIWILILGVVSCLVFSYSIPTYFSLHNLKCFAFQYHLTYIIYLIYSSACLLAVCTHKNKVTVAAIFVFSCKYTMLHPPFPQH